MAPSDDEAAWSAAVDELTGVEPRATTGEASFRSLARESVAGAWLGCYLQPVTAFGPVWSELVFDLDGSPPQQRLRAEGEDRVGPFDLTGELDATTRHVRLAKSYRGRHSLDYRGIFDDGAVRGVWTLPPGYGGEGLFAFYRRDRLAPSVAARIREAVRGSSSVLHVVTNVVAQLSSPFRVLTLHRHRRLVDDLRERHASLFARPGADSG